MKKARFLYALLALVTLLSCLPMSVLALSDTDVDFSQALAVDTLYEGTIEESFPYISLKGFSGYAKGFTVNLKADTDYALTVSAGHPEAYDTDRAAALLPVDYDKSNPENDVIVFNTVFGTDSAELKMNINVDTAGQYYLLVWGYCTIEIESGSTGAFGEGTYLNVLLKEGIFDSSEIFGVEFDKELTVGTDYNGPINEDDPFLSTQGWDGYAQGFYINLEAGEEYAVNVEASGDDADYVDRAISVFLPGFASDPSVDAPFYCDTEAGFFTPEKSGLYYVLVWGFCEDYEGNTLYGDTTNIFIHFEKLENQSIDIYTAEDLMEFNAMALDGEAAIGRVKLVFHNDIDMAGMDWDSGFYGFDYTVLGNGHTVKNFSGTLLGRSAQTATVVSLTIEGDYKVINDGESVIYTTDIGRLIGRLDDAGIFEDCHVIGDMIFENYEIEDVGMLVGDLNSAIFSRCSAEGKIYASCGGYVGGLFGYSYGTNLYISYCKTDVSISIDESYGVVGGLAGSFSDNSVVYACGAKVDIAVEGECIGGLLGCMNGDSTIANSYTEGTVKGAQGVGGLVGCIYGDGGKIINCYSIADVSGVASVGGLVGKTEDSEYGNTMENCYTAGSLTALNPEEIVGFGSLAGTSMDMDISNCYAPHDSEFPYVGGGDTVSGAYSVDFSDNDAVQALEDSLNNNEDDMLLRWGGRNAKNGPTFFIPEAMESLEITLLGYEAGGVAENISVTVEADGNYVFDYILCTDYMNPSDTVVSGALEAGKQYYLGIMVLSEDRSLLETDTFLLNGEKVEEYIVETATLDTIVFYIPLEKLAVEDVNKDGSVDVFDYIIVKSICMNTVEYTDEEYAAADVNADGSVDVFDYLQVKTVYFN